MYDDILVPTDGEESTEQLLAHVRDIAGRRGATVHALSVVDDRSFFALDDDTQADVADELRGAAEGAAGELAGALESDGIPVRSAVRRGDPATEILACADAIDADLVIMGTHGDEYRENMLGSTAQRVIAESPVPVLTVPIEV